MSAAPHELLEAEPYLEGDVPGGAADPPACHQPGQLANYPGQVSFSFFSF